MSFGLRSLLLLSSPNRDLGYFTITEDLKNRPAIIFYNSLASKKRPAVLIGTTRFRREMKAE